jgi:two-component sensor histidine kinase
VRDRIAVEHVAPAFRDIDHAIPCGLIVNELVSSALTHAFRDSRVGRVVVTRELPAR